MVAAVVGYVQKPVFFTFEHKRILRICGFDFRGHLRFNAVQSRDIFHERTHAFDAENEHHGQSEAQNHAHKLAEAAALQPSAQAFERCGNGEKQNDGHDADIYIRQDCRIFNAKSGKIKHNKLRLVGVSLK